MTIYHVYALVALFVVLFGGINKWWNMKSKRPIVALSTIIFVIGYSAFAFA